MTALTEFNYNDWRSNSAPVPSRPLSWIGTSWPSPVHSLTRIYQSLSTTIVSKIEVTLQSFRSDRVNANPLTLAAMIYTTVLWASLIDLNSVTQLIPEHVAQCLEVVAALWVIAARRTLSRATVKPASLRVVVDSGAYRFVRHPIYAGRAILYGAFMMSNFNIQNAVVLATVYAAQLYRIFQEEKFLMQDSAYRTYAENVPYRLIYGVF